jgi:hypothetical protein
MMIPGCAPSTPASNEPARVTSLPFSYSAVSSPMYQTFPSESWAYQSSVISTASLVFVSVTTSRTTRASTPFAIRFVLLVIVTSTRCSAPSWSVSR